MADGVLDTLAQPITRPDAVSLRVGLIGYGAIGRPLAESVAAGRAGPVQVTAVLVRDPSRYPTPAGGALLTSDPAAFLDAPSELVVEAGGHEALRQYGEAVLRSGRDLMVVSAGAFADDALLARLLAAAGAARRQRPQEHTADLQSRVDLVCRLLVEK